LTDGWRSCADRVYDRDAMDLFVVDPHPIYRRGTVACLRALPEVVAIAEAADVNGAEGDPALRRADVLVLDRDVAGADALHARLADHDRPRVVLCAWSWSGDAVCAAMRRGACGVLLKGALAPTSLGGAVRAAARGATVVAPELLERAVQTSRAGSVETDGAATAGDHRGRLALTLREQRVLRLIADGLATRDVARELSYSERTVKSVVHDAVMKLGARSRSQAVARALRSGLI
jgi:DNA-binding NarL/FixJ family response regulator